MSGRYHRSSRTVEGVDEELDVALIPKNEGRAFSAFIVADVTINFKSRRRERTEREGKCTFSNRSNHTYSSGEDPSTHLYLTIVHELHQE